MLRNIFLLEDLDCLLRRRPPAFGLSGRCEVGEVLASPGKRDGLGDAGGYPTPRGKGADATALVMPRSPFADAVPPWEKPDQEESCENAGPPESFLSPVPMKERRPSTAPLGSPPMALHTPVRPAGGLPLPKALQPTPSFSSWMVDATAAGKPPPARPSRDPLADILDCLPGRPRRRLDPQPAQPPSALEKLLASDSIQDAVAMDQVAEWDAAVKAATATPPRPGTSPPGATRVSMRLQF